MRFDFKTTYGFDLHLIKNSTVGFWYAVLAALLIAAPFFLPEYFLGQLTMIAIFALAGLGLIVLTGMTGQVSLGHAAFVGIGAYAEAYFQALGVPFPLSIAGGALLAALAGMVVGLPALRLTGIYLAIATLAFGAILEEIFARWESITGGSAGRQVGAIRIGAITLDSEPKLYAIVMLLLGTALIIVINLKRSPSGRALVAIRDSEVSARSLGIDLAYYKTLAFALSAGFAGIAGGLYAHKVGFISPEQFSASMSIDLLVMIFVGGVAAIHGAFFGAVFIIALPQLIALAKDALPQAVAGQPGVQPTIFGLVLILFILLEPNGLHGLWVKIRTYLDTFPLYRKGLFERQRRFARSERVR